MLAVLNDDDAEPARRDRMAIAAAPYCHSRMGDGRVGKKDWQEEESERADDGTEWEYLIN
jgi:phage terminase small subunit